MNSMFNKFSRYFPEHWDSADYTRYLYVLKTVPKNTPEFVKVTRDLPWPIQKVSRIQNPSAYLRYTLQGEYLLHQIQKVAPSEEQVTHQDLQEYQVYHPVFHLDTKSAILHNCDVRHYTSRKFSKLNKNPKKNFFTDALSLSLEKDFDVIILMKRGIIDQITYTIEHYPTYLLEF